MRWLRSLLGLNHPTRRELMATQDALAGLEARVEMHYGELKSLRGLTNALRRHQKDAEDAPGETIGDGADTPEGARSASFGRHAPHASTAHLARRFRGF